MLAGFVLTFYACDSPTTSDTDQNRSASSNAFNQGEDNSDGTGTEEIADTEISEDDLDDSWFIINEGGTTGTVEFIEGPGSPLSGTGSALFTLENSDDEIGLAGKVFEGPTSLSSITGLSYTTYTLSDEGKAVKLQLNVSYNNESEGTLVFEPVIETGDVSKMNEWQTWDLLTAAGWKAVGAPENESCSADTPCTLSDIIGAFPNASIVSNPDYDGAGLIQFKAGPDSPGFQGAVDGFMLSLNGEPESYDFEADQEDSDDSDEYEETAFEGEVLSVDETPGTFTLTIEETELTLKIEDLEVIEDDSDIKTLSDLAGAIADGLTVEASGEYYTNADDENIVTEVEFEIEEGDEDSDEYEETAFEGEVLSVNETPGTFILTTEETELKLKIEDLEVIEDDSDIKTLSDLAGAIADGLTVEASGEYYTNADDENIVTEVEFEIEERDEDGDKEDDSSDGDENPLNPQSIEECKNGGWVSFGFKNQGQCIRYVNTGEDSRGEDSDDRDDSDDPEEIEFKGEVLSVNETPGTFILTTEETELKLKIEDLEVIEDDSDIKTLSDLADAIADGLTVEAAGDYYTDENGDNIVIEVEFEEREVNTDDDSSEGNEDPLNPQSIEDCKNGGWASFGFKNQGQCIRYVNTGEDSRGEDSDDSDDSDDPEEMDFEGYILTANSETGIITLAVGDTELTLIIEDEEVIEEDSDIQSLSDLGGAIADGLTVEASGEYYRNEIGDNIVTEVEFEIEEDDDDD